MNIRHLPIRMRRRRVRPGAATMLGATAGAAALAALGYAAVTWLAYGHSRRRRSGDPLLDRYIPDYVVAEHHTARVRAPAEDTFAAACAMDLDQSALVRAIFRGRELLLRSDRGAPLSGASFIDKMKGIGWRVLLEEPGREIVLGAVTQPWEPNVRFRGLAPDEFRAFDEQGWVKIVWCLASESRGEHASVFRTETRVAPTDAAARRRFRRYWLMVSAGIRLIRRASLSLVRNEAERRWREREASAVAAPAAATG